jgi:hypothetical protein
LARLYESSHNLVYPDRLTVSIVSEQITFGSLASSHIASCLDIVLCAIDLFKHF